MFLHRWKDGKKINFQCCLQIYTRAVKMYTASQVSWHMRKTKQARNPLEGKGAHFFTSLSYNWTVPLKITV